MDACVTTFIPNWLACDQLFYSKSLCTCLFNYSLVIIRCFVVCMVHTFSVCIFLPDPGERC